MVIDPKFKMHIFDIMLQAQYGIDSKKAVDLLICVRKLTDH